MAKSYLQLQQSRLLIAGLTLGLLAVIFGVLLDLILTGQRTTIPLPTQKLIAPLNPQLDLVPLETVEGYEFVSFEQAREGVRQAREQSGGAAVVELLPVEPVPDTNPLLPDESATPTATPPDTPAQPPSQPPEQTPDSPDTGVIVSPEGI